MLKQRVLTAVWFVSLFLVVIFTGGELGLTILITVFGVLAVFEFYRVTRRNQSRPFIRFGMVWTALFIVSRNSEILARIEPYFDPNLITPILIASAVILPMFGLLWRNQKQGSFTSWTWTVVGTIYVGWLLGHLVAIRGLDNGLNWVLFTFFITWISDTVAFFVGKRFGRHKLASTISPKKTWEGTFGAIGGAIAISIPFFTDTPFHLPLTWWQAIILAVLVCILGQLGDLMESLLKRDMGVKDSGGIMLGHGGILDRMDSLIFTGVVVYYFAIAFNNG